MISDAILFCILEESKSNCRLGYSLRIVYDLRYEKLSSSSIDMIVRSIFIFGRNILITKLSILIIASFL